MKPLKPLPFLLYLLVILSCSKTPEPITYGEDMCHFCRMTIVTKTHASQLVTDKGKQYKFDAIECMIRFLGEKKSLIPTSQLLISNYNLPGEMINAKTASYIISPEISSPMGANLTGFKSRDIIKLNNTSTALYFNWESIFKYLNDTTK